MKDLGHLKLMRFELAAGHEWNAPAGNWRFVQTELGAAYWLGSGHNRSLSEGELVVACPSVQGVLRASQLGGVLLRAFAFDPDLLLGLFTVAERHQFENGTGPCGKEICFFPSTHPASVRFASLKSCEESANAGLGERAELLAIIAGVFSNRIVPAPVETSFSASALHRFQTLILNMPDFELLHHSPGELARLCECSARHFNRLFRKHFGRSVRARLAELRQIRSRQSDQAKPQPPEQMSPPRVAS